MLKKLIAVNKETVLPGEKLCGACGIVDYKTSAGFIDDGRNKIVLFDGNRDARYSIAWDFVTHHPVQINRLSEGPYSITKRNVDFTFTNQSMLRSDRIIIKQYRIIRFAQHGSRLGALIAAGLIFYGMANEAIEIAMTVTLMSVLSLAMLTPFFCEMQRRQRALLTAMLLELNPPERAVATTKILTSWVTGSSTFSLNSAVDRWVAGEEPPVAPKKE
jgi:hypothetical protein